MTKIRRHIEISGIIQGVGFRPFIYRTAMKNNLLGFVKNDGAMVIIDIEGNKEHIDSFIKDVRRDESDIVKIISIIDKQNKQCYINPGYSQSLLIESYWPEIREIYVTACTAYNCSIIDCCFDGMHQK